MTRSLCRKTLRLSSRRTSGPRSDSPSFPRRPGKSSCGGSPARSGRRRAPRGSRRRFASQPRTSEPTTGISPPSAQDALPRAARVHRQADRLAWTARSEHPRTRLGRRDVGPQVALFALSRAEPEIDVELAAPEGERWIVQTESFCDARERVYLQLADATPAEAQRGDRCAQGVGEMGQGCGSAHSRFR